MVGKIKPEDTDAIILCGGRGSRLAPFTQSIPKPLLAVGQRPFLFYLLLSLRRQGFRRYILATHYLSEKFQDFLKSYTEFAADTMIIPEAEPLGTGGALRKAATFVQSPFFVALNGDSFVSQPLADVLSSHVQMENAFTMVAVRKENVAGGVEQKGGLAISEKGEIIELSPGGARQQWVNAGVYVLDRNLVLSWPTRAYDLETNLVRLLGPKRGYVFYSESRLLDIGTPECYLEANQMPGFFGLEENS